MAYPDGHHRYRIVTDDDEVLESHDNLFDTEQALCRALNEDCDVYLQDAEEIYASPSDHQDRC